MEKVNIECNCVLKTYIRAIVPSCKIWNRIKVDQVRSVQNNEILLEKSRFLGQFLLFFHKN